MQYDEYQPEISTVGSSGTTCEHQRELIVVKKTAFLSETHPGSLPKPLTI